MMSETRLELARILPPEDARGRCPRCRERLQELVGRLKGVQAAELVASGADAAVGQELAVRFDPALTSAAAVEEQARRLGLGLGKHFAHQTLEIEGLDCAECAPTIERLLARKDGVLWAGVNFAAGLLEVEFDPRRIDAQGVAGEVRQMGYGAAAPPGHRHTTVFYIPEMDCDEEIALIRKKLGGLAEVQDLEFNLVAQRLTVTHRSSAERLARALREIRMTPRSEQSPVEAEPGFWEKHKRLVLTVASGLLAAAGLALSVLGAPPAAAIGAYVAAVVSGGWLVARRGVMALRTGTLDINVLMCLAVIGAAVIGEWLEGATVIFLFSLANLLESHSMNRARRSIRALMELAPATARGTC